MHFIPFLQFLALYLAHFQTTFLVLEQYSPARADAGFVREPG
jgi:hypothetical protein